jgi:hypothetical protein
MERILERVYNLATRKYEYAYSLMGRWNNRAWLTGIFYEHYIRFLLRRLPKSRHRADRYFICV